MAAPAARPRKGRLQVSTKLFVGNLDFKTTQGELQALFSQVGPVSDVFLPNDRATGRPRGFAFVEYESEDHAREAIERFNNFELGGRALRVNAAEERRPGGGGPRPSFGGFGPHPGGGEGGGFGGGKPKGSRRNVRARKRSL